MEDANPRSPEESSADAGVRPPPPMADLVRDLVRRVVFRGRKEVSRAAKTSRQRLEIRQLEKDRTAFWVRLGKTSYRLVEAGELDHPALRKAMTRIDELEQQLEVAQAAHVPEQSEPDGA